MYICLILNNSNICNKISHFLFVNSTAVCILTCCEAPETNLCLTLNQTNILLFLFPQREDSQMKRLPTQPCDPLFVSSQCPAQLTTGQRVPQTDLQQDTGDMIKCLTCTVSYTDFQHHIIQTVTDTVMYTVNNILQGKQNNK